MRLLFVGIVSLVVITASAQNQEILSTGTEPIDPDQQAALEVIKLMDPNAQAIPAECNPSCPFIYKPVCARLGETEETFANQCLLNVRNCINRANWIVLRPGKCK